MKNLVALVTGSSRGIGKSIVIELAKVGVNVVINYNKHENKAKELESYIKNNYDVSVLCIKCDVSKEDEVINMVNTITDTFGHIDILVNNAGICHDSTFFNKSVKNFQRIVDVNLIGTYLCSKYVGEIMKKNKQGKIVNISSSNAIDSYYPESLDYDASKAGVVSLTHNMAIEYAPYINVNCICPGWIKTDMNKDLSIDQIEKEKKKILLNRFGNSEEIAKVVVFLVSAKASYINDTIIKVDGGRYNG